MICAAWLFLLVPSLASAAGWTDMHGENSMDEKVIFRHVRTVTVQQQGNEQAYAQHVKADIIVSKDGRQKNFSGQDCLHSTRPDGSAWLSCSPDGTSPLAGTTYHQLPPARDAVSPWTCARHCKASSPRTMAVGASRGTGN